MLEIYKKEVMVRVCRFKNATPTNKIAAFDFHLTLFRPKFGKLFYKHPYDWELMNLILPFAIKKLRICGYTIVVFSEYETGWMLKTLEKALEILDEPMFLVVPCLEEELKPNINLMEGFYVYLENVFHINNFYIDRLYSFYIGDALGRDCDWSDADRTFAENIGISCFSPEGFYNRMNVEYSEYMNNLKSR